MVTTADTSKRIVRVLIVDDADPIRLLLRGLLANAEGIEVIGEAGDGAEAIELARQLRPDVVIMDVTMPVMDGIEATTAIVEEFPHIRVLGLSISADNDTAEAMVAAGAADYLTKGGAAADLIAAVRGRPR
ncbi:MAG: response regulator transcription factor [Planctomycetota bacterium]|nr:response regulator transcription factor [Planctomycetaceae bacterium]MDQ3329490.1 response regulator transcription factor [Planctomycetota bacterium]